jgi:GYF domain 2
MANDTAATAEDRAGEVGPLSRLSFAPAGEWLFERDGQVFGPIAGTELRDLLVGGAVGPATRVAPEGKPWRAVRDVPELLVEVRKLEARARVGAELAAARGRVRRRNALRWSAVALGVAALVVAVSAVAWLLAVKRPWESRSKLLDDFGDAITVGAVHVGGAPAPADEEIAVPADAIGHDPRGEARPRRVASSAASRAAGGAAVAGGGLVQAQYDPERIQQTVARWKGTLAPCLREEAQRAPDLAGDIPIEFAIANDGKVAELWIDDPRLKSGPLRQCLLDKLRLWAFEPFPGQRPVVSLTFRMGSR